MTIISFILKVWVCLIMLLPFLTLKSGVMRNTVAALFLGEKSHFTSVFLHKKYTTEILYVSFILIFINLRYFLL